MHVARRLSLLLVIAFAIGCASHRADPVHGGDSPPADNTGSGGAAPQAAGGMSASAASGGSSAKVDAGHAPRPGDAGTGSGGTTVQHVPDRSDAGVAEPLTPDAAVESSTCLDAISPYTQDGPFAFEAKQIDSVKLWVPMVPAGCKVPIVHWSNGTGAT